MCIWRIVGVSIYVWVGMQNTSAKVNGIRRVENNDVGLLYVLFHLPFGMLFTILIDRARCRIRIGRDEGMTPCETAQKANKGRNFIQICMYIEGIHVQGDMGKSCIQNRIIGSLLPGTARRTQTPVICEKTEQVVHFEGCVK